MTLDPLQWPVYISYEVCLSSGHDSCVCLYLLCDASPWPCVQVPLDLSLHVYERPWVCERARAQGVTLSLGQRQLAIRG